jgi:hypothetical protein
MNLQLVLGLLLLDSSGLHDEKEEEEKNRKREPVDEKVYILPPSDDGILQLPPERQE